MRRLWLLLVLGVLVWTGCRSQTSPTPRPSRTPEPIVPSPTPSPGGASASSSLAPVSASPPPTPASASAVTPRSAGAQAWRDRFGVGVGLADVTDYPVDELGIGWYLNWQVRAYPARPAGVEFWQMVQVSEEGYRPQEAAIRAAASANPGSFWIIGNEPDVRWQNNTTPERYAVLYYELYNLLKSVDPTCRVVIGGVSQPTPLRLAYLDRVLSTYEVRYGEPMPVDVWNVHNFILREERDSWGVGIPPGMDVDEGALYEIDDHDDMAIFRDHVEAFRRWMADRGQLEKPLVISEYGILMPEDYGFDDDRVRVFMEATFDYFLGAADDELGYPEDGDRLVQWWCWYSLAAPADYYPTGNLFDPQTKALTDLGAAFADYERP